MFLESGEDDDISEIPAEQDPVNIALAPTEPRDVLPPDAGEGEIDVSRNKKPAQAANPANETVPDQGNKHLWQIAAVTLTLTTASVLLRQIQNRAKANAAKLAALGKPPFMAAIPNKATEGAYVTVEQLGDNAELRILSEPVNGKLTRTGKNVTYQPEADNRTGDGNKEDRFTYHTETGTGKVELQLQTEAGQQKIAHALHDALPNHDAPVRLTIKAAKDAPTLILTDVISAQTGQSIALPNLEAYAHDDKARLNIVLGQLPQGGTVSDGKHHFTAQVNEVTDITDWNLNTLTFLPPANFNGSFTLHIKATESQEGQADAITSVSVKINAATGNGNKRHPVTPASAGNARGEMVSTPATTKTASITVHSVLPDPDTKPKETEIRYHVINLASSRAPDTSKATPPVIDWTKQAELGEVREMGCLSQFLASTKEKVRSLAEITGLHFKMEER